MGEEASYVPVLPVALDRSLFGLSESTRTDRKCPTRGGQAQVGDGSIIGPNHFPLDAVPVAVLHDRNKADGKSEDKSWIDETASGTVAFVKTLPVGTTS